jgi:uncharacterized membrane protein YdjX (TVP38/TMEM64 family)
MLMLGLFFTAMMVIFKFTGLLTVDNIKLWLEAAQNISPVYVAAIVVTLLFADLIMAVPSLTITILAGFFLGPVAGAAAAVSGMMLAGLSGYGLSRYKGEVLVRYLIKEEFERQQAKETFLAHGVIIILLSRAAPVIPEVSACMAGLTRMPFLRFLGAWSLSSIPYAAIAAYAGSVSSLANPMPAIFAAIFLSGGSWLGWAIFTKWKQSNAAKNTTAAT